MAAPPRLPPAPLPAAVETAAGYARQALAPETLRAYRHDWAAFEAWCGRAGAPALPAAPTTIAAYLASLATTHGRATLRRRLAALSHAHRLRGHDWAPIGSHAAIRNTLRGIARRHGIPPRKAAALGTAELRRLVASCDSGLTGRRDRALLLLGYAAALRRSELVGIHREHLTFPASGGLRLLIPRAKGDPEGQGEEVGVPRGTKPDTCPVRALEAWLLASATEFGPVFRRIDMWGGIDRTALHPDAVRQILRRRAEQAGLSVAGLERLSPHGLRAGFVTEAYKAGARDEEIMAHTRHRDLRTMRSYVRRAKLDTESPARLLGL